MCIEIARIDAIRLPCVRADVEPHSARRLPVQRRARRSSRSCGSVSYSYDALGRLANAVYSDASATTTITYSYDAAGNRTSVATTSP